MSDNLDVNVEVGPRDQSFIEFLKKDLSGEGMNLYIEHDRLHVNSLVETLVEGYAIAGEGQNLPLASESVSTFFAKDVFGDPKVKEQSQTMPSEWFRAAKPGCKAIILETGTPLEKNQLVSMFENSGWESYQILQGKEANKIFEHPDMEIVSSQDSYAIIFVKP